ncbi:MAG: hypothetical protein WKG00_19240 [Polyangiaceae bacterium]
MNELKSTFFWDDRKDGSERGLSDLEGHPLCFGRSANARPTVLSDSIGPCEASL